MEMLTLLDRVGKSGLFPLGKRMVAMCYARKANDDGTRCFPGVAWVARWTGLSAVTVRQYRRALLEDGVLEQVDPEDETKLRFHAERLPKTRCPGIAHDAPTSKRDAPTSARDARASKRASLKEVQASYEPSTKPVRATLVLATPAGAPAEEHRLLDWATLLDPENDDGTE